MSLIVDGTTGVTFNDSSLQGAAASPYVLKNRIINGDMRIDQRNAGASVTITTGNPYTLDRWWAVCSASSKYSVQQNAGSVTPPAGYTNYLGVTSLSSYSVSSGDYFWITQRIEGFNVADLAFGTSSAKSITISFLVYSSLTGTFGAGIRNSAANRCYPFSYTISSANTWTQISVTIPGDTSGTWITNNGVGIELDFGLGFGSTYSGTAGAWTSSNIYVPTGSVSVVGTNGATFYITGVQLEIGTSATPFERRLYGQELINCQRYYQKYTSTAAGDGICFGGYGFPQSSSIFRLIGAFPITMRTGPTFSYSNLSVSTSGGTQSTVSSSAGIGANSTGYDLNLNVTVTTGTPYFLRATSGNNGYVDFSAEL